MQKIVLFKLTALLLLIGVGVVAAGQFSIDSMDVVEAIPDRAQLTRQENDAPSLLPPTLSNTNSTQRVMIQLEGEAAAQPYARALATSARAASRAGQTAAVANLAAQDAVLRSLGREAVSIDVIFQVQKIYNGIAGVVDSAEINKIRALPGVKSVEILEEHFLDNKGGIPLIGAPSLWQSPGAGLTGQNISIGIIDTGVDYIHTTFGGSGLASDYTANDESTFSDNFHNSAKFKGGYDFVGDDYNANDLEPIIAADDDPMDCHGHGTHVAGSAAGYGVQPDGTTYNGSYATAIPINSFNVGPGVAPQADLYGLRIFGCGGSTNMTVAAIEWAVDPNNDGDFSDRLDVINLSLGGNFGSPLSASAVAIDNAAAAGVIAVMSAGNSGDRAHFVHGAPGVARYGIAVASVQDAISSFDAIEITGNSSTLVGYHSAAFSIAYPWTNPSRPVSQTIPVTGTLVYPSIDPTGCSSFSAADAAQINGNIVLLDWTEPSCGGSVGRTSNALAAGAIGVIIADNAGTDLRITGSSLIPAVMVPDTVGNTLRSALGGGANLEVRMGLDLRNQSTLSTPSDEGVVSGFTSRGPAIDADDIASVLKPDLAAPGGTIFSAKAKSGTEGSTKSGTSMASPQVAGSLALLRQMHPDWSVEQLKALIINTATQDVKATNGTLMAPARVGAGTINLASTLGREVIAYNGSDGGYVNVSFGNVQPTSIATYSKQIVVENRGSAPVTYDATIINRSDAPGMVFTVTPSQVSVAANSTTTIELVLTADPSLMDHSVADTTMTQFGAYTGIMRNWLTEESGYVDLTPSGGVADATTTLRVPIYASGRPAAAVCISDIERSGDAISVTLSGNALAQMNQTGHVSMGAALELQYSNDVRNPSVASYADVAAIGAASTLSATGTITDSDIYFGIETFGQWSSPSQIIFQVSVDADRDGADDYYVWTSNAVAAGGVGQSDDFVVLVTNEVSNTTSIENLRNYYVPGPLNSAPFYSNIVLLPVNAASIGLTSPQQQFDYEVLAYDVNAQMVTFESPKLTFSAEPGLSILDAGSPYMVESTNTTYSGTVNQDVFYNQHQSKGLLWFHMLNGSDASCGFSEIRSVQNDLFLPIIVRSP